MLLIWNIKSFEGKIIIVVYCSFVCNLRIGEIIDFMEKCNGIDLNIIKYELWG